MNRIQNRESLKGLSVVVTRTKEQTSLWCAKIKDRGGRAVGVPSIVIKENKDESAKHYLKRLNGDYYKIVLLTSVNAVLFFVQELNLAGLSEQFFFGRGHLPLYYCVGDKTSSALLSVSLKLENQIISTHSHHFPSTSLGLLALLQSHFKDDMAKQTILFPRSQLGQDEIQLGLRKTGCEVDCWDIYTTLPWSSLWHEASGAAGDVAAVNLDFHNSNGWTDWQQVTDADWITFASPSAVRGLYAKMCWWQKTAEPVLPKNKIACIGPTTAQEAKSHGWCVDLIASRPSFEVMLDDIAKLKIKHSIIK